MEENKIKRTERGWKAHFIDAAHCRFGRNTLLELGEKRYVISTVGAYFPDSNKEGIKLNIDGYYETLVFEASWFAPYWDADIEKQVTLPDGFKWHVDTFKFESDMEANDMHEKAVEEVEKMMRAREEKSVAG